MQILRCALAYGASGNGRIPTVPVEGGDEESGSENLGLYFENTGSHRG